MTENESKLVAAINTDDRDAFKEALKPLMAKRVETMLKVRKLDMTQDLLG
jgi:hypothetical protein